MIHWSRLTSDQKVMLSRNANWEVFLMSVVRKVEKRKVPPLTFFPHALVYGIKDVRPVG